jgi:hypothetical protein
VVSSPKISKTTPHEHIGILTPAVQESSPASSTKRKQRLGDIRKFKADLRAFAKQFGQDHAEKWECSPRKARELAVRYFRKYLPRGRSGRPRSSKVTRAIELLRQGKRWSEIYAEIVPANDRDRRRVKQLRLRAAVRFRSRRQKNNARQAES